MGRRVAGCLSPAKPAQSSWPSQVDSVPPNTSFARSEHDRCVVQVLLPSDWQKIAAFLKLSQRQVQIAQGIVNDEPDTRIAERLGISFHTVHSHLERLYRKTGVNSRVALAVRVLMVHARRDESRD